MNDIIKYYAKAGVLLAIKMNGETVLGTLVKDPDSNSGYAFKSAICPVFIKEENLNYQLSEDEAVKGINENVVCFLYLNEQIHISFDHKGDVYHRLVEVRPFDLPIFYNDSMFA